MASKKAPSKKTQSQAQTSPKKPTGTNSTTDMTEDLERARRLARALHQMGDQLEQHLSGGQTLEFDDQNLQDLMTSITDKDLIVYGQVQILTKSGAKAAAVQTMTTFPGVLRPTALPEAEDRFLRILLDQIHVPLKREFSDFINTQHRNVKQIGARAEDTYDTTPPLPPPERDSEGPAEANLGMGPDDVGD